MMNTSARPATVAKWIRRHGLANDSGQAMVEFALVLPILLILVLGIFEFGRAWNAYQVLTDAAREGARVAVVADGTNTATASDTVTKTVRNALGRASLIPDSARITFPTGLKTGTGQLATVNVTYPYNFTFLGPLLKWGTTQSNITLRTTFVMRNE